MVGLLVWAAFILYRGLCPPDVTTPDLNGATLAAQFPVHRTYCSVGEPRALTREVVEGTLQYLPADKPRYLMGVGTPEEIVEFAGLGIDMMDCVLPTRAARHGLLFTSEGKISKMSAAKLAGLRIPRRVLPVTQLSKRGF